MKTHLLSVSLAIALGLSGCARVRIVGRETNPREKCELVHRCGWNLSCNDETRVIRVGRRETIGAVTVRMNYAYALATVLTFGLYMPFDLCYEVNQ